MANLQLYTKATVYIDGSLLTEESEARIERNTNAQEVITVAKGFAGLSPGAPVTRIQIRNAVPAADFELDPDRYMKELSIAEITIFAAGRTLTVKGFITRDNFDHAANKESMIEFDFVGGPSHWE